MDFPSSDQWGPISLRALILISKFLTNMSPPFYCAKLSHLRNPMVIAALSTVFVKNKGGEGEREDRSSFSALAHIRKAQI